MARCSICANENPDRAKFCSDCGAKLEDPLADEERKVVTIVFCDLVGFTQRSESLDPEDVRAFLLPYYDLMTEEVTLHGGRIDKLFGDGAMAVFGAPIAHEDDPERAIRASLRVLRRLPDLGLDLQARMGINTGEVVVDSDHSTRGDALTGDTVNTASRFQAVAPVGGVVVGQATYAATKHVFDYEVLAPIELKGKADPVPIYRPTAPTANVAAYLAHATPFVGRDEELEALIEAFERSRRKRRVVFMTIVAEPGIGKSRLVREFARYVEGLPDLITWRQGRCLPYGAGISFWALGEIVKAHAGILDSDGQETVSKKLDAVLTESDPRTRSWVKDRLAPLVGLETSTRPPERGELFTAWRRFLGAIAEGGPLVLVIEDLHWADDTLVEFLEDLRASLSDLPVLVVVTARPEVTERHPRWLAPAAEELRLRALDEGAMRELVSTAMQGASAEFLEAVLERAGGSPLYAEQLAAMRRQMPIAGASMDKSLIPPSIQALLAARIDQLPVELKAVLLDASVIGRTFWSGAVATLGGLDTGEATGRLRELQSRELMREEATSAIEGETEFAFVHALVRDVAYGALSRRPRFAKHKTAAAWITEQVGRPLGDVAEIVVSHLDRARDAAMAAGLEDEIPSIDDDLVDALLDAGDHARRTDMRSAIGWLERALALLDPSDARRLPAVTSGASAAQAAGDLRRAAVLWQEAVAGFRARGEMDDCGEAIASYAAVLLDMDDDLPAAEATVLQAKEQLAARPGRGLLALLTRLASWESMWGDNLEALRRIDEATRVAEKLDLPVPIVLLEARGGALLALGDLDGDALVRQAVDLALENGEPEAAAVFLNNLAAYRVPFRGYRHSLETADESIALAHERGLDPSTGVSRRIGALYHLGRWNEVLDEAPAFIEQARAHGQGAHAIAVSKTLTRIQLARGGPLLEQIDPDVVRPEAAASDRDWVERATLALHLLLARGDPASVEPFERRIAEAVFVYFPHVPTLDGLVRSGRPDLAASFFERWRPRDAATEDVYAWGEALLAEGRGEAGRACQLFRDALAYARRMESMRDEADGLFHLGRCTVALGWVPEGVAQLAQSRALWQRMQADARIGEIDAFLATLT